MRKLSPLAFGVFKLARHHHMVGKHFLAAVSGGLDSMVLFSVLNELKDREYLNLSVAHFHHGQTEDIECMEFRNLAYQRVAELTQAQNVRFYSACGLSDSESTDFRSKSSSEALMRQKRYRFFEDLRKQIGYDYLALGHHRMDLFETRLIRLIRGTGPIGLQAMDPLRAQRFRPFLNINPSVLKNYAALTKLKFLNDPSNLDVSYLRNWMRRNWLVQLEKYRPGATTVFARSLEIVAQHSVIERSRQSDFQTSDHSMGGEPPVMNRLKWKDLSLSLRAQDLVRYLHCLGVVDFRQQHIAEILKRVDTQRKRLTFRVAGCWWQVDAEHIRATPIVKKKN